MATLPRVPKPVVVSGVIVALAVTLCTLLAPAFADDANDSAALKKQVTELNEKVAALESKVAALEAELKQQEKFSGTLSEDEKEKFKKFMSGLPDAERIDIAVKLEKMTALQANDAMRAYIKAATGDSGSVKELRRRDQAAHTLQDLRLLDSATDQYAIETNKSTGAKATMDDLRTYLKKGTTLYNTGADVLGHAYGPFTVDSIPMVPQETFDALSDVADASYWSPFR